MSHLAHTVKLKTAMVGLGQTNLAEQTEVIESAYIRAIIRYLAPQSVTVLTDDDVAFIKKRLNQWNNVTPINGQLILATVRQLGPQLIKQAVDYGQFQPWPPIVTYGDYNPLVCPAYKGLVDWLVEEMVTNRD